jgi:hypothetical protein
MIINLKKNIITFFIKNKNQIILFIFLLIYINFFFINTLNLSENSAELEIITKLVEKYLNNIPVLTDSEKVIAQYWKQNNSVNVDLCPFSKLISHGLSKKEAHLILNFFNIQNIEDLQKLNDFLKK